VSHDVLLSWPYTEIPNPVCAKLLGWKDSDEGTPYIADMLELVRPIDREHALVRFEPYGVIIELQCIKRFDFSLVSMIEYINDMLYEDETYLNEYACYDVREMTEDE